jgi:hypothetical protein
MKVGRRRTAAWVLTAVTWVGSLGMGFRALILHERTAGAQVEAPAQWPEGTSVARDSSRHTLVVVLHTSCPCSRATVSELARLMERTSPRLAARVLFVVPSGLQTDPSSSELWSTASAIPGAVESIDLGGQDARRFGALTSGQVLLFDSGGRRVFQGGITASRGHEGDNAGRSAIEALVANEPASSRADVFGCALHEGEGTKP